MALTSGLIRRIPLAGGFFLNIGWFTQAKGDSGGDIDTKLAQVYSMVLTGNSTAVSANWGVINEAALINGTSIDGSAVTIVTSAGVRYGHWHAVGIGKS
jgi:hypothetical protein